MPELPEVQITVNQLAPRLRGRTLRRVVVRDPKIRLPGSLAGRRVMAVRRRGKHIIIALDDGRYLLVHLRMTGWFALAEPPKYRLALHTDRGAVYFVDSRRFGQVRLVDGAGLERALARLGPEPLGDGFDPCRLRGTRRAIKVTLLDQRLVAGVGNIYANEALWRARVHPRRSACRLSVAECRRIARGLAAAMRKALRYGPRIYEVQEFVAYGREGQPCRRCRTGIRRVTLQQRSTYFCPRCQRL